MSYFAGDKNALSFAPAIENLEDLLVPGITLTEAFDTVLRQRDEESALIAIAHIKQGRVIALDSELAVDAGSYCVFRKLPFAGSIIFASARKYDATIWTQGADFKGLPKVKYFPARKSR